MENPIQSSIAGNQIATYKPNLAVEHEDVHVDLTIDRERYKVETSRWRRIRQHSLTQMLFISIQAFCGPALSDAISGLGGGGLATPKTSNIRFALDQGVEAIVCLFGAVLVNIIGVKWSLVIGAASFPLLGASYYCNSQFENQWFLILTAPFTGIGFGFWNISEGAYVMSIAPEAKRGKYLALWIVSRNAGQLVGGAINLAKNSTKDAGGGIDPSTYIPFIIIEALALPFAFGICEMKDVVRSDGTKILILPKLKNFEELKYILKTYLSKIIYYLSNKNYSQRKRAQFGFWLIIFLNLLVYIWSLIIQIDFIRNNPGSIDWNDKKFLKSFLPYFFIQTTGPLAQVYTYWILSSFAESGQDNIRFSAALKAIQCVGNAIAFGVSAADSFPLTGMILNCSLMVACIPGMWYITSKTPDRIPADVIAEEMILERRIKMEDPGQKDALDQVHTREVATLA